MIERGLYIVGEGGDGTGKSTQIDRMQARLATVGIRSIQIHEPNGFVGDPELGLPRVERSIALRKKIKDGTIERTPWQNVHWFNESRSHNWQEAMSPALKMGIWVLAARNHTSTSVYQGLAKGIPLNEIEAEMSRVLDPAYIDPDLTVIFDTDQATRSARIATRGELEVPDTFEMRGQSFQDKINNGYRFMAERNSYPIIDASRSIDEVSDDFWQYVEPLTQSSH